MQEIFMYSNERQYNGGNPNQLFADRGLENEFPNCYSNA